MPAELKGRRRDLLILALLGALLYLPGLGLRDVWNPDEARYAEVARETRQLGHWAVPHLNGQVYSQKPPLFFWSIAAAAELTRGSTRRRPASPPPSLRSAPCCSSTGSANASSAAAPPGSPPPPSAPASR